MRFSGLVFGFSSLSSTLVSLRFSVAAGCCAPCCVVPLWALRRSAPLVLFGGCEGRPSCLSLRPYLTQIFVIFSPQFFGCFAHCLSLWQYLHRQVRGSCRAT